MLKKSLPFIFLVIFFSGCKVESFTISGELIDIEPGSLVYLDKLGRTTLIPVDSVKINESGEFKFSGKITIPEFFLLRTNNDNFLTTLIEPGENLSIKAYADSFAFPVEIRGSAGTQLLVDFDNRLQATINMLHELNYEYEENINSPDLPLIMEDLDKRAVTIIGDMSRYSKNFIDNNIGSLASLIVLYKQIVPGVYVLDSRTDGGYYMKVDSSLFTLYPESEPVKQLHIQLEALSGAFEAQKTVDTLFGIGAVVPDISLPNPDGEVISLYSTRGQVVLVDFWAAWCPPCRAENPNLVKVYDEYHGKGFEIFQVSLDQTREAWLKGIEADQLGQWIHVSDLKYWESEVVPLYNIESIPANYLLDREGRVIATGLRGGALEAILKEVLD
ncbi:MAG TPA: TlpA disulfide reductase family protein [Bacteroidales bacterium]|nr:TlpA disulfide reductase family protein [Bacteroidales bacterium]